MAANNTLDIVDRNAFKAIGITLLQPVMRLWIDSQHDRRLPGTSAGPHTNDARRLEAVHVAFHDALRRLHRPRCDTGQRGHAQVKIRFLQ